MSTKIFLGPNYLLDKESLRDFIICDECGAHYSVEKIQRFLKLYFFLLPTVEVPSKEQQLFKTDPNSTFEALQRLPDHLKFESPSSQGKEPTTDGEGDYPTNMDAVSFSQVMEANVNKEGKPINSTL